MSTDYVLIDKLGHTVELCEHSCKFDLDLCDDGLEPNWFTIKDLTLDDLKKINQELTNVISYFDPDYDKCEVGY